VPLSRARTLEGELKSRCPGLTPRQGAAWIWRKRVFCPCASLFPGRASKTSSPPSFFPVLLRARKSLPGSTILEPVSARLVFICSPPSCSSRAGGESFRRSSREASSFVAASVLRRAPFPSCPQCRVFRPCRAWAGYLCVGTQIRCVHAPYVVRARRCARILIAVGACDAAWPGAGDDSAGPRQRTGKFVQQCRAPGMTTPHEQHDVSVQIPICR
jgi:hypothetical protein